MAILGRRWRPRAGRAPWDRAQRRDAAGLAPFEGGGSFSASEAPASGVAGAEGAWGELVQLDGSHHDWLEGRGPACVLMAYIDDASSRVLARFYAYEGTIPAMDSFQRYVTRYGIPLAVYADKHTTYQSPAQPTVDEQLAGVEPTSQFGRALGELGVDLIPAHSPQAKGRVERLFHTFQDRLIKEMRLAGIATTPGGQSLLGGLPADLQPALYGPAGPGRRSASAEAGGLCAGPDSVHQDDPVPAEGRNHRASRGTLSDSRHPPGRAGAGGRARGWDDAAHAQGPGARLHAITSRAVPAAAAVNPAPHSGARSRRGRTIRGAHGCCLNTNDPRRPKPKPDISTLGERGHFYLGLTRRQGRVDSRAAR